MIIGSAAEGMVLIMRILHIEDQFFPTSGYQLNFLAKYNKANGNETFIICSDTIGSWGKNGLINDAYFKKADLIYSSKTGVNITRLKSKGYISGRAILNIREIIDKIKEICPDIILVHGNDTLTGINILKNIKKINFPIFMDSHMLDIASRNKLKKIFRVYYKYLITPIITKNEIKIVGVDSSCNEFMNQNYGIPHKNLEMIPLGYDPDIFDKYDNKIIQELKQKYGFSENEFIFIYTGKISPDKKLNLLAKVFREKLESNTKTATLIIVGKGSGEYFEKFKAEMKSSENRIVFYDLQPVEKLNELYNLSDLAIWPGASSLSMFDAQACGLPIIAEEFDVNTNRLKFGNGFTYKMDNVEDLRNKVENVFNMSREEYSEISENAVAYVKKNHSYKSISEKFEKLMEYEIREKNNMNYFK